MKGGRMSRTIYVVVDYGGEWEDAWEFIVRAFASKTAAEECARKRTERNAPDDDSVYFNDYLGSYVKECELVEAV